MRRVRGTPSLAQLARMRLFSDVDETFLARLPERLETCDLDADEMLLSPHSPNRHLYMLLRGELNELPESPEHPPLRRIEAGECIGEVSFCDQLPPSAYVISSRPSRVLRLHARELPLLGHSPQLMRNLLALLCERVRLGDRLIVDSEHNANIDMLTGVFNRRWLAHIFERERARCMLGQRTLCMLMVDIDGFKAYNDRLGHLAGDHALCLVARMLGAQLRAKDILIRFGGEEFVVLLPELDLRNARQIAERLCERVAQTVRFETAIGPLPGVTISIGLAHMLAADDLTALLERADRALYRAKQQGRNRVCG